VKRVWVRLHNTDLSMRYRKIITNWPAYQGIPSGSISHRLKLWLRVLSSLLSSLLRMSFQEYFKLFTSSRKIPSTTNREVLVIANGPSAGQLSRERIQQFVSSGGMIFAMNGYIYSELAEEFPPDYYLLTDPDIWLQPLPNDRKFQMRLQLLLAHQWKSVTIAQPVHQKDVVNGHAKYIYLTPLNSSGLWPSKNPFSVWGLVPSTVLIAFALANKMGFRRTYFAGLDGDSYRYFYSDEQARLKWEDAGHHFYATNKSYASDVSDSSFEAILINSNITPTIGDALYAEAILRRDFMRLSRNEFINVTPSKYFDLGKRGILGLE
jgi:hypothetical protein